MDIVCIISSFWKVYRVAGTERKEKKRKEGLVTQLTKSLRKLLILTNEVAVLVPGILLRLGAVVK